MLHAILNMVNIKAKTILQFNILKPKTDESVDLLVGRLLAAIILFSLSLGFLHQNKWYSEQVSSFIKWYAYNFEMDSYSYCNSAPDKRVAYIDSDKIILATKANNGYAFKVQKCDVKL
jgi:hypothetical protein